MEIPKYVLFIYTHLGVDLDACAAVWAFLKFYLNVAVVNMDVISSMVRFHPANWGGKEMGENDVALDMAAGGRGWKGEKMKMEDGTVRVHSCFADIVAKYASPDEQRALAYLVKYVDIQDMLGAVVKQLVPNADKDAQITLSATGLNSILWGFHGVHKGDNALVLLRMAEIFEGFLHRGLAHKRAEKEVSEGTEFFGAKREVALFRGSEEAAFGILFGRGVRVIVYADGFNMGVRRASEEGFRVDHDALRAVVLAAGEEIGDGEGLWFAHEAGFLFCRGTRPKAPATSPSKVSPRELAEAVVKALAEYDAAKRQA